MAGVAVAGCSSSSSNGGNGNGGGGGDGGSGNGDSSGAKTFGGWMENVGNYDGVADKTGNSKVTVSVGANGNGGNFAFAPPAIKIDTGTKVVWKWTGKGNSHNVVENGDGFKSKLTGKKGYTFEQTFDSSGTIKYYCSPHKAVGMKGVIVVK